MRRTREGASLKALVTRAIPLCRKAEQQLLPRTGPGRPPVYPEWVMAVLIMVATAKKRKSKSAQYRLLDHRREELCRWLEMDEFPVRSTYFDRFRKAHYLFEIAIELHGEEAVKCGLADARLAAGDKSMIEALGPRWNKSDRERNRIPKRLRGVDRDSQWGHSKSRGWVQGYSYEVVVAAGDQGLVFPLLASVGAANASEAETFLPKADRLPASTEFVLADGAYDTAAIAQRVERTAGKRSRTFLCPVIARGKPPQGQSRSHVASPERKKRQQRMRTRTARKIYAKRSTTVEPFNDWFKGAFEMNDKVWHRGLDNNRTQLLAAIFTYQLLVREANHGRRKSLRNGQIRALLDAL
jgi:Transposase DDE domain